MAIQRVISVAAIGDVVTDVSRATPMTRLLQGDVGSGKTAVAATIGLLATRAGYRIDRIPVRWRDDPDSRFRPLSGSLRNLLSRRG